MSTRVVSATVQIENPPPPSPIYVGKRTFLGRRDLVVSFYTERCQFKCTYCNLPASSHPEPLDKGAIAAQIEQLMAEHAAELGTFQQFSAGNEGSILDPHKFPREMLDRLVEQTAQMPNLEVLSLETRPEYIKYPLLQAIQQRSHAAQLDITIGFETQDDHLREVVLKKTISRKILEQRIALLGDLGVRLTSYVMLKPGPWMSEQDGIDEAIATINYLYQQCQRAGVELIIYLNPVYAATGTPLLQQFILHNYRPPLIQSVAQVIAATRSLGIAIYTGLWSEQNAVAQGDYRSRGAHDEALRRAIKHYNQHQDYQVIASFIDR